MVFWLFSACSSERRDAADLVLMDDSKEVQQDKHQATTTGEDETEDVTAIRYRRSKAEKSEQSAPSDERNFVKPKTSFSPGRNRKIPSSADGSAIQPSRGSDSDDPTPEPALPLTGPFSSLWPAQCVLQECADAGEDEQEDSFIAVFANPHFIAADRGGFEELPQGQDEPRTQPRSTLKGMTIRVHAPRQRLPELDYEVRWQVGPPEFPGLVRVQGSVVRERFEAQYACSETGRPIEVHQEGERVEVARVTCYRLRPRILQQHHDMTWQEKYPSVARFLEAVPNGPEIDSYYQPRGTVQAVSQLLLEDLYVHPEFRGGGLGLSLLDHASRKVGEVLASVVLGLPPDHQTPDDEDKNTLEHYFALLGYKRIHPHYLARTVRRVLLEEACPTAPILDPARREAF
mmetsp:Transcript_10218/g.20679  ORF Transcript_10218/g.20679 Transcript_10218/m.20679 type:complete len:402 (+) Transcript_10218:286-1491(+)